MKKTSSGVSVQSMFLLAGPSRPPGPERPPFTKPRPEPIPCTWIQHVWGVGDLKGTPYNEMMGNMTWRMKDKSNKEEFSPSSQGYNRSMEDATTLLKTISTPCVKVDTFSSQFEHLFLSDSKNQKKTINIYLSRALVCKVAQLSSSFRLEMASLWSEHPHLRCGNSY